MQLPDDVDSSNRIPVIGDAPTKGFAGLPLQTERFMLFSIRPCDYVSYRSFIMSHRARKLVNFSRMRDGPSGHLP